MTCEEMIEKLLAVKKPDARLKRFLVYVNPVKQKDGSYHSITKSGVLPIIEFISGERWERILAEWIKYLDE